MPGLLGQDAPTPPTAAGGLIFLAGQDGKVRALDAATGVQRWCFLTAGPVLMPPTLADGRAYVGSGDGFVYCLEAASGRLLWRFRAAPVERRIMLYGALASTWPVNTGVLVADGVAYLGAGVIDGIRIMSNGDYLVSHWEGPTYIITPSGEVTEIMNSIGKFNVADFEYVEKENLLIIPTFVENRVIAFKLAGS